MFTAEDSSCSPRRWSLLDPLITGDHAASYVVDFVWSDLRLFARS